MQPVLHTPNTPVRVDGTSKSPSSSVPTGPAKRQIRTESCGLQPALLTESRRRLVMPNSENMTIRHRQVDSLLAAPPDRSLKAHILRCLNQSGGLAVHSCDAAVRDVLVQQHPGAPC